MNIQRILKWVGPILIVLAIGGAVVMIKTKPQAQRKKMSSMVPVVEVTTVQQVTAPVVVECMGTVIADSVAELQAEVKGRIVRVHANLVAGAFVPAGELLIEIDASDYEQAIKSAEATLKTAQSNLRIEEGRQAVARHEMELIGEVDPAYQDLMLRTPQLQAAEASVASAASTLESAHSAMERTQIYAPFDAVVQMENITVGDYAQVGRTLVELVATDRYFVRASMPVRELKFFPKLGADDYSATLVLSDGAERDGSLYKLLPGLTKQGRMAQLLIAVKQPLSIDHGRAMLLDESVNVKLAGIEADQVYLIDRKHLRDGSVVWMMDDKSILHICPAQIVQGYASTVMIRFECSENWKLVTSNIAAPIDGMQLKMVGQASQKKDRRKATGEKS